MTNKQILSFLCIMIKSTISQMVYNNELEIPPMNAYSNANLKNIDNKLDQHLQLVYTGDPKSGYILYQKLPNSNVPYTMMSNNENSNKIETRSECNQCVYPEGCCQYQCPECQRYGNILLTHGYKLGYPYLPALGNNEPINAQNQVNMNTQINSQLNQQENFLMNPAMNLPVNTIPYQLNPQTNQQMTQQMTQQVNPTVNLGNPPLNSQPISPVNAQPNYQNTPEPSAPIINTITQIPAATPDTIIRRPVPTTVIPVTTTNDETETEIIIRRKHKGKKIRHNKIINSKVATNNYTNAPNVNKSANTTSESKTEVTPTVAVPVIIIYNNDHPPAEDLDYPVGEVEKEIEAMSPNKVQGTIKKHVKNNGGDHTPEPTNDGAEYYDYDEDRNAPSTYTKNGNYIKYDPYVMVRRTIKNRLPESQMLFNRMKDLKLKRAMLPDRKLAL